MKNENNNEIEINGVTYVVKTDEIKAAVPTEHKIIIAQRGWIFIGHQNTDVTDSTQLLNASVVRSWSNGKGIGGLCVASQVSDYMLDIVGTVAIPNEAVIASIDVTEW